VDENGFASGFGTLTTSTEIMQGQMWKDFKHGFVIIWYPNGTDPYYVGFMQYNEPHGFGTLYYADGATFSGFFLDGMPIWGRIWWPNNVEYCGCFNPEEYMQRSGYGVEQILDTGSKREAYWNTDAWLKLDLANYEHAKSMVVTAYFMTGNNYPRDIDIEAWMNTRVDAWKTVDDIVQGLRDWQKQDAIPCFDENKTRDTIIAMYFRLFGFCPEDVIINYDVTRCKIGLTTPEDIETKLRIGGVR
jgi:hypothetical protein